MGLPVQSQPSGLDVAENENVVQGIDDEIVPYEEAGKIKARIPHADLVTVEGAFHDVVFRDEHWKIVAEALDRFLK